MLIKPTLRSELLNGQVAIVTGGSQGIGGATSEMLAANGAHVVIADIDESKAAETAANMNKAYGEGSASVHISDLVQPDACDQLVKTTLDTHGRIDIVVNNAGYVWDSVIAKMTDDQFQAMLDIHLIVPFRMARACAPYYRQAAKEDNKNGIAHQRKIILVSSMAGAWGLAGAGNYASAKAGMLGLMRTLAAEFGPSNVNVNAIAFGIIQTRLGVPQSNTTIKTAGREIKVGMTKKQTLNRGEDPGYVPTEEEMYASKPLSPQEATLCRTGTIREAADAIFWLASPLSNYVTGQVIPVTGGAKGGFS